MKVIGANFFLNTVYIETKRKVPPAGWELFKM